MAEHPGNAIYLKFSVFLRLQPAGGEISSSISPGLELRQTCPIAEGTIFVQGTIPRQQTRTGHKKNNNQPEGVSNITSGSTDVADKLA